LGNVSEMTYFVSSGM